MTTNTWAKRSRYPKDGNTLIAAIPSTVSNMPLWKAIAFAGGLVLGLYSDPLHAAPSNGGDTVQGLYDALLSTMKNGRALGQSGRFALLEPVIRRSFDIAALARLSVGPTRPGRTEAQRQRLTESFGCYMAAIYADRFDSYAGQKLQVTGELPDPAGVMVKSQIVKAGGEPVKLDYKTRLSDGNWLISDISVDSAISEVGTRRSEFSAILKTDGIGGLISALNRKAEARTTRAARTF